MLFDLPCEVHYTPDQRKAKNILGNFRKKSASDPCVRTTSVASSASSASRKRSILSRIGAALSRSSHSSPSASSQSSQSLQSVNSQPKLMQVTSQHPTYPQTSASESLDFTTENFAAMGGLEDADLLVHPYITPSWITMTSITTTPNLFLARQVQPTMIKRRNARSFASSLWMSLRFSYHVNILCITFRYWSPHPNLHPPV